ncbi:glycoside hydrolase family 73 [Thalassotalea loyana]|uniref:Glycoside hydrolase family 73 n=1 Tax=Thalassotalea loyana TaxID=280483 RepID=A0ABQ6HCX5_9GAMM|nr:glucosaminidase domain-containing protein [Thalassotalea loyana]GLX85432.1 glycoside hydrolase family 73 [Thalassotalea loyana]
MKKFSVTALSVAAISVMLAYPFTKTYGPDEIAVEKSVKPMPTMENEDKQSSAVTETEEKLDQPYIGKVPNFGQYKDVKQKKTAFFNYLRPVVVEKNNQILAHRTKLLTFAERLGLEDVLSDEDVMWLNELAKQYRVKNIHSPMLKIQKLLNRVDIVPVELVLVQGANESAWGTSRFAREGLNLFGMWCYRKGCGIVPSSRTEGMTHEVASYDSLEQAVSAYLRNLNTNHAYLVFRNIREQLRASGQPLSAEILATGLLPYSERGSDYVLELTNMLRHNQAYFYGESTAP